MVGAGGAGLRAAVAASAGGASVGLVCKSLLGKAHTVMAEGGVAAALGTVDDRDNWKVHFCDTMRGGQYMSHWRLAEVHAREAPERVRELQAWGAVFDRTKSGRILQRNFGGHRYPRLAHVGDRTGLEMIRTLQDHGIHQGVEVHMEFTVTRLLKDGDRIVGAFGYERERGRFELFRAPAVILATGGIGRAYQITSNSWEYTGDGIGLAYEAGAQLMDMEFVQFHPTGMLWPLSVQGILVTEGVRGEGGVLVNSEGHRFMFDDIPELYRNPDRRRSRGGFPLYSGRQRGTPAARAPHPRPRGLVAFCAKSKKAEGAPTVESSWISPGSRSESPRRPSISRRNSPACTTNSSSWPTSTSPGSRWRLGPRPITSWAAFGSIPTPRWSCVPGLFAVGECATGLHGANRLGGNSLSDLLVFGKRAGEFAARYSQEEAAGRLDEKQVQQAGRGVSWTFYRLHRRGRISLQGPTGTSGEDARLGGYRPHGSQDAASAN